MSKNYNNKGQADGAGDSPIHLNPHSPFEFLGQDKETRGRLHIENEQHRAGFDNARSQKMENEGGFLGLGGSSKKNKSSSDYESSWSKEGRENDAYAAAHDSTSDISKKVNPYLWWIFMVMVVPPLIIFSIGQVSQMNWHGWPWEQRDGNAAQIKGSFVTTNMDGSITRVVLHPLQTMEIDWAKHPEKEIILQPGMYVANFNILEVNTFYSFDADYDSWEHAMLPCNGINGVSNATYNITGQDVRSFNAHLIDPTPRWSRTNAHFVYQIGEVLEVIRQPRTSLAVEAAVSGK